MMKIVWDMDIDPKYKPKYPGVVLEVIICNRKVEKLFKEAIKKKVKWQGQFTFWKYSPQRGKLIPHFEGASYVKGKQKK